MTAVATPEAKTASAGIVLTKAVARVAERGYQPRTAVAPTQEFRQDQRRNYRVQQSALNGHRPAALLNC